MSIEFHSDGQLTERRFKKRRLNDKSISIEDIEKIKGQVRKQRQEFDMLKDDLQKIQTIVKINNESVALQNKDIEYIKQDMHKIKEIVQENHETLLLRTSDAEQIPLISGKVDKLCAKISVWSGGVAVLVSISIVIFTYIINLMKNAGQV